LSRNELGIRMQRYEVMTDAHDATGDWSCGTARRVVVFLKCPLE